MQKISADYMLYSEGIAFKFPGYDVDKKYYVRNVSDIEVNPNKLRSLLLSKDILNYKQVKSDFFGNQARFLNQKAT